MNRSLKILSIIVLSAASVIGIRYDFITDYSLNNWGYVVLLLIIISTIVAIVLEILDYKKAKKSDLEKKQQFERLKFQMSKPFLPLKLEFVMKYTPNYDLLKELFKEDIEQIEKIVAFHSKRDERFIHPLSVDFPYDEDLTKLDNIICALTQQKAEEEKVLVDKLTLTPIFLDFSISSKDKIHLKLVANDSKKPPNQKVFSFRLFNRNLYLNAGIENFVISENDNHIVSIYDLIGKKINLRINYVIDNNIDNIDTIYLTSLKLVCGSNPYNHIPFDRKQLGITSIKSFTDEQGNPINTSDDFGKWIDINYEILVTEEIINELTKEMTNS